MRFLVRLLICGVPLCATLYPVPAVAQATKFIASKACGSNPSCTTAGMDNTSVGDSGLLAVCVSSFADASAVTVSSSPANTFSHTDDFTSGSGIHTALFYALAPSVSAAQTVSASGATFTSIFAMSFSNVGALHGSATGAGSTGDSVQPGSQTPSVGDLAVSCGAAYATTPSVSGFFIGSSISSVNQTDGAGAFTQATTTTALNPTWTMTGTSRGSAAVMALFGGSTGSGTPDLSLSSPSLASDGKTLTSTISGCSTPLSPSSGVTGVTAYSGGVPLYVSSVTTSDCVLTAHLGSAQQSGDAITMDLDIGLVSNLTDAAGDTPIGQSAVAVTNGSSQAGVTANYNGTDVYAWGAWSSSGGIATATSYPSSSIEFACSNSTDAQILGPSAGIQVQTDGGSYTTITPSASGYSWQPIATGLSVGTHQFKVIAASVTASNSVRCSSSVTAALTPIAAYSGAVFYSPQSAPLATYMAGLGAPQNANFGGITWTSANGGFAVNSSATKFTVYTYGNGGSVQLFQDATLISTVSIPNDSTYDAVVLGTGLTGTHTYRAIWQGSNLNDILTGLIVDSAPAGPAITAPPVTNACGDSIAFGFGIPGDYQSIDWWKSTYQIGNGLSLSDQFQGASGHNVYGGPAPDLSTLCPTLALPSPSIAMWLAGGVNDQISGVTQANFGPAYLAMITNTASASGMMAGGGKIFTRAILPNTADNFADRSTFNATIQTEVNSYNAGSPTVPAIYIPTDNWIDVSNSSLWLDGVPLHPNAAGYAVIANLETPIMAGLVGSSYTISCPGCATAKVGVPVAISVCLAGGATWTALNVGISPAETLTLSSTLAGTFNQSSPWNPTAGGNCDSSSLTFTPSSAGSGTISTVANQAGWVDPSGASITATAAASAGSSMMSIF